MKWKAVVKFDFTTAHFGRFLICRQNNCHLKANETQQLPIFAESKSPKRPRTKSHVKATSKLIIFAHCYKLHNFTCWIWKSTAGKNTRKIESKLHKWKFNWWMCVICWRETKVISRMDLCGIRTCLNQKHCAYGQNEWGNKNENNNIEIVTNFLIDNQCDSANEMVLY